MTEALEKPMRGVGDAPEIVANILIVDDKPANLLALEAILEPLGQRLFRATSGNAALRLLLGYDFAVILMDVQMPGSDGLKTAALIKQRERSRDIPIIFLTAISRDVSHIFMGYAHGAVDYLLKPFEAETLRSKVSVFVDLFRRSERVKRQAALLYEKERDFLQRESEQRYRRLTDSMPLCMWAARPDGEIYYCNRIWMEYSGLSLDESRVNGFLTAIHPDDHLAVLRGMQSAFSDCETKVSQYRIRRHSDGAYRWHIGRMAPEWDAAGRLLGWIVTATDIDDQKRAEQERADVLAREQKLREEAEAANRAKDEFLATVSHELRTPLNAILGWTCLLRTGSLEALKADRALATIERNARAQTQLIDDLLDVSRIITGKLRLELKPVDLAAVIGAALEAVKPAADAKGITLKTEILDPCTGIAGDPDRLQQVAWNLLLNAIKFTPEDGEVSVKLERLGSMVRISVSDTGKGISSEFLPFVFDRFRQADSSSTRVFGGLGLGLAIVRHFVELHGGTVEAESSGEGRGATFRVLLPIRALRAGDPEPRGKPEVKAADAALAGEPDLGGLKVLVVDDEADARELLTTVLGNYGASVIAVETAKQALSALSEQRPDVMISDIGMPGEDGYSLIKRVRAQPKDQGGETPSAALTAYARADDGTRALAAGYQAHLAKPAEPRDLAATIARLAGLVPRPG